ncbi:CRISPR-associated endonuclease Cas1 [Tsukamurella soli]|uniref:CRISPR-associated endonuclease Cas1 n=1 Tax=Tsukamurella soli TaxID=644556 RepID=A0ABP8KAS1_9ACTN
MTATLDTPVGDIYTRTPTDPRVLVVDGYGIRISVHRGHLTISDGIGSHRRERRIPRIERTLQRIVVLSGSGYITLDAFAWCADVGITLLHLDRNGDLITSSSPPADHNARLRRAQAFAGIGGPNEHVGLALVKHILGLKLDGQAQIADHELADPQAAQQIRALIEAVDAADTIAEARGYEGNAGRIYWNAWTGTVALPYLRADLPRIPDHWQRFNGRSSKVGKSGRARFASDPINAMLNYSYRLAEVECRLACHTIGLDPALGFLHFDEPARDSLAVDLLEILRPHVDRHVLTMINTPCNKRRWPSLLHESRDGQCRLVPPLTHELAEHLPHYAKQITPHTQYIANAIANTARAETRTTPRLVRNKTIMHPATTTPIQQARLRLDGLVTVADIVTDEMWQRLRPLIPPNPKSGSGGRAWADDRTVLAGILCVTHHGTAWAQIPKTLGVSRWTCKARLDRWTADGTWNQLNGALDHDGD